MRDDGAPISWKFLVNGNDSTDPAHSDGGTGYRTERGDCGAECAAATGVRLHLIGKLGFRLNDKALRRAGLDYWQHVDLHQHLSWDEFRAAYPDLSCYALSDKVSRPYTTISFKAGDCLVLGSETQGLPERLLHGPGALPSCTIPMPTGHVRCINVAMAAGIVTYEALRQINLIGKV
ncbi:MAG: TrmH family RNA methyltransferase [Gemmatales bacterium]